MNRFCIIRMVREFSAAIHVQGKRRVAKPGQHLGALAHIGIVAPPLVHHQHTGAPCRTGIVPCQVTTEAVITHTVFNDLGAQGGNARATARRGKDQQQDQTWRSIHKDLHGDTGLTAMALT
jgi:hypothetical protein